MLDFSCPVSLFILFVFLGKLRRREKRQMSKIQREWVYCEELFGAMYSDESSQAAQCGDLGEADRESARGCPGGRGWGGLKEKA